MMINRLWIFQLVCLILFIGLNLTTTAQLFPNGDFENGPGGGCQCPTGFTCENDAGRIVDGVHPVWSVGELGCVTDATNYAPQLGANSGSGSVYFYAGLDRITSPSINFSGGEEVCISVWYCGPQGSGGSGQNTANAHFSFQVNNAQVGPDVQVPTNTGWTEHTFTTVMTPGNHTFSIYSGGAAQYSMWFDDFNVEICSSTCDPSWSTTTACSDDPPLDLDDLVTGNTGGIWSGTGVSGSSFDPSSGTQNITYTAPCGEDSTQTISVEPSADASWMPPNGLCESSSPVDLNTLITGTPDGSWFGTGVSGNNFDPSFGTQDISYSVGTDPCGDVSTQTIPVNSSDASWNTPGTLCETEGAVELSSLVSGDPGGAWSGTGIIDPAAGLFDPEVAGIGSHTITYTISGACPSSSSAEITVTSQLDATITPVDTLCISEDPITLMAVDPGGSWSGAGIIDPNDGLFDPGSAGAGTWEITYMINGQCGDEDAVEIVVVDVSSPITPIEPQCADAPDLELTAEIEGGTWSGTGITDPNEGIFSPAAAGAGNHQITYSLQTEFGCLSQQTIEILVNPLPNLDFSPNQMEGCLPLTIEFNNTGDSGICEWDFGDGQTSSECGFVEHTYYQTGSFSPSLTIIDDNHCSSQIQYEDFITVHPNPLAGFSFSPHAASTLNGEVNFSDESAGEIIEYHWDFADAGSSDLSNPVYTFEKPGTKLISLLITDINGCTDSVAHALNVAQEFHVYIPNTITSDWDGLNDVLEPIFIGVDEQEFEFQVFDRWGAKVYESTDLHNTVWLGGVDDYMVIPGPYTWKLKLRVSASKEIIEMIGQVNVIR